MTAMIGEDSSTMRKIIGLSLKNGESQIIEAENLRDGLDKLAGNEIDIFLVDVNMPVMNGIDFVKKVGTMPKYEVTTIIILTTEINSDIQEKNPEQMNG